MLLILEVSMEHGPFRAVTGREGKRQLARKLRTMDSGNTPDSPWVQQIGGCAMQFRNRTDAGWQLGEALQPRYGGRSDVLVLALPRGGVPVAAEVARELHAPLDIFVVRKLGVPGHEELAMGAIATGGAIVFNEEVVRNLGIPKYAIDRVIERERVELERRERDYRGDRPAPPVKGKTVILVDDGLATGASMHAAVQAVRALGP